MWSTADNLVSDRSVVDRSVVDRSVVVRTGSGSRHVVRTNNASTQSSCTHPGYIAVNLLHVPSGIHGRIAFASYPLIAWWSWRSTPPARFHIHPSSIVRYRYVIQIKITSWVSLSLVVGFVRYIRYANDPKYRGYSNHDFWELVASLSATVGIILPLSPSGILFHIKSIKPVVIIIKIRLLHHYLGNHPYNSVLVASWFKSLIADRDRSIAYPWSNSFLPFS